MEEKLETKKNEATPDTVYNKFMDLSSELSTFFQRNDVSWSPELKRKWNVAWLHIDKLRSEDPTLVGNVTIPSEDMPYIYNPAE